MTEKEFKINTIQMALMEDCKKAITEIVKKQMDIVGPAVALSVAQKATSVKLSTSGEVMEIIGDPKTALEQVAESYINFSGEISKMILKSVMKTYPDITINHL